MAPVAGSSTPLCVLLAHWGACAPHPSLGDFLSLNEPSVQTEELGPRTPVNRRCEHC